MKIFMDYLEKYVEWLVLALAIIWLGWVGFAYWVEQPVEVTLNNQPVAPERVDQWTTENLVPKFNHAKIEASQEHFKPVQFYPQFADELTRQLEPIGPQYVPRFPGPNGANIDKLAAATNPINQNVGVLAAVAPPTILGSPQAGLLNAAPEAGLSWGKSVVNLPVFGPVAGVITGLPLGANAGAAVVPAAMPAPGAGPAAPNAVVPTDVVWITFDCKYEAAQQLQNFLNARNPAFLLNSAPILSVTLERQQLMPNGDWGPAVEVPPTGNFPANALPPIYPKAGDVNGEVGYLNYAGNHQLLIVQPPFFAPGPAPSGDTWWPWLEGNPNLNKALPVIQQQPPPPPVTPPPPPPRPRITNNNNNNNNGSNNSNNNNNNRGRRGGRNAPAPPPDADLQSGPAGAMYGQMYAQAGGQPNPADYARGDGSARPGGSSGAPASPPRPAPGQMPPGQQPYPPVGPGPMMPPPITPQDNQVHPNGPPLAPAPQQALNPTVQQPFEIWAHDVGIVGQSGGPQPGCTYRYRMVIKFYNPLYNTKQCCKNPDDAKVFDLTGVSDWSDPVMVPRLQYFYVADNAMNGVKIDLYEWEKGRWTVRTLQSLKPGDSIGDTGATVVDLRPDWREADNKVVLIADADGKLEERTYKSDSNNPEHKDLRNKAFTISSSVSSAIPSGGY